MSNSRLILFTLIDLVIWTLVYYLVLSDKKKVRAQVLRSGMRTFGTVATRSGNLALRCEASYYQTVRP